MAEYTLVMCCYNCAYYKIENGLCTKLKIHIDYDKICDHYWSV